MSKGEETRHTILDAALRLASIGGLEGVTIGALAEQVGMSKSGLFAHFSSKERLDLAILDETSRRFVDQVVAPALRERRGEPRVRALFNRWLAWSEETFMPGGCIFMAAAHELDEKPGPVRDRLVETQRDWLGTLAQAARIAIEEKHFSKKLDVEQFAFEVYAIAQSYHTLRRLLRDPKSRQRADQAFERLLENARTA